MGNNEHTIVYLIGMGPGNSDCLTREAVQALSQATVCIGASRVLAIWKSLCEEDGRDAEQTFYNAYKAEEIAKLIQNHVGEMIAVVFSGDIGFYSGAKKLSMMLRKAVGKVCNMVDDTTGTTEQIQADKTIYELCYIPGLSSVQYFLTKLAGHGRMQSLSAIMASLQIFQRRCCIMRRLVHCLAVKIRWQRSVSGLPKWDWEKSR